MKRTPLFLGLAFLLAFGFFLAGCGNTTGSPPPGPPDPGIDPYSTYTDPDYTGPNIITITGLEGKDGYSATLRVLSTQDPGPVDALCIGAEVSDGKVTFNLVDMDNNPWAGNGSCWIDFFFIPGEGVYIFTNGEPAPPPDDYYYWDNVAKFTFSEAHYFIHISKFVLLTLP